MTVVKLVQLSQAARSIAAGRLGIADVSGLLRALREQDVAKRVGDSAGWPAEEFFQRLGYEIVAGLTQVVLPKFTRAHLILLLEDEPRALIGRVLKCKPQDATTSLLDPEAIKRSLKVNGLDIDMAIPLDSEFLLLTATSLKNRSALEGMYGEGFNGWGDILNEEGWLLKSARLALRAYAAAQGWPNDDPSRILAACLDSRVGARGSTGPSFDRLATTWLRQRIKQLVEHLREQSLEMGREAALYAPHLTAITNLPPWLEMFERYAFARALPYVTRRKRPMSDFIVQEQVDVSPLQGPIDSLSRLAVANVAQYERQVSVKEAAGGFLGRFGVTRTAAKMITFGRFDVLAQLSGTGEPKTVLNLHELPIPRYEHLLKAIPQVLGSYVSPGNDSIGARVLRTPILVDDPFLLELGSTVQELASEFILCLILVKPNLPISMDAPWLIHLEQRLPDVRDPVGAESVFTKDIKCITKELQDRWPSAQLVK